MSKTTTTQSNLSQNINQQTQTQSTQLAGTQPLSKPLKSNQRLKVSIDCSGASHVKQSFVNECDVNQIMAKYKKTGLLPSLIKSNPSYGDYSDAVDFHEAHELVLKAREQFEALPAKARERFQNNPESFLEFAGNPANKAEMGAMGLLKPEAAKEQGTASKPKVDAEKSEKIS